MHRPGIVTLEEPTAAFRRSLLGEAQVIGEPSGRGGPGPDEPLCLAIRDGAGSLAGRPNLGGPNLGGPILGGLWGRFHHDWLFIELIFVPEDRRGQELGSALLAIAEAQARAWGAIGVWLDTFSFQARGFYERHGFAVFGEIADYPAPHRRFFLSKRLDPVGPLEATHPAIERIAAPEAHHRDAIATPLSLFNDARIGGGTWSDTALALAVRDADDGIDGGLWAVRYYNWLSVQLLVVPDRRQRQGVGSALLERAEAEAVAQGCVGCWLSTFSFQDAGSFLAPAFYARQGYVVFGEIADHPAQHRRLFFSKRL